MMNKSKININAFTLVEILVSITIFSIMFISIMWIYIISTDISLKSDINRLMQENIKNLSSKIYEDIRKDGIIGVSGSHTDECNFDLSSKFYKSGDKLCTKSGNIYYLAKKDLISGQYLRVSASDCSGIADNCVIAMGPNEPLTNSYVAIKDLKFYLSNDYVPKVTMNIVLQPATNKGVKPDLIKESKLIFQTTVSERPF